MESLGLGENPVQLFGQLLPALASDTQVIVFLLKGLVPLLFFPSKGLVSFCFFHLKSVSPVMVFLSQGQLLILFFLLEIMNSLIKRFEF